MVEEIKDTVVEQFGIEVKEKLSKIWRNIIIFLFVYSAFSTVVFINTFRTRSDLAEQLLKTTGQLARAEELRGELDAEIRQLKSSLLRAGADVIRLESDNKELEQLVATGIGHNTGARGDTIQLTSIADDSRRIIEESIALFGITGETE